MKALIVDDDFTNRLLLQTFLSRYGECHIAVNGKEAVEAVRLARKQGHKYDFICMDIMMPEMDGYETTKAIRKLPGIGALPIIALTAKAMKGDREKCLQAGASDYVAKPVDLSYLFSVMRIWMAGMGVPYTQGAAGSSVQPVSSRPA